MSAHVGKIAIVGSGNVAWHIAKQLKKQNVDLIILGRNTKALEDFSLKLDIQTYDTIKPQKDVKLYILAVKDSAISQVAAQLKNQPLVHTAGSIPMDVLSFYSENYGVIYPFQTFRKKFEIDWQQVPVFTEACCPCFHSLIDSVSSLLSPKVYALNSEKRKFLHLAGVLTNNFINHLLSITREIFDEQGLDFEWIYPLLAKTFENAQNYDPRQIQTGPAVRNDTPVINEHLKLLKKDSWQQVYAALSKSITEFYKTK